MADIELRTSGKYGRGKWLLNRSRTCEFQIFDVVAGVKTPRDCSSATEEVHLQAYKDPDVTKASYLVDETMTKINGTASDPGGATTSPGSTGIVRATATIADLVADGRMKVVIIDTAVPNARTKSGKKETVAGQPWEIDVRNDGPQA